MALYSLPFSFALFLLSLHSMSSASRIRSKFSEFPKKSSDRNSEVLNEEAQIIRRLLTTTDNAMGELYDYRVRPQGSLKALPNASRPWAADFEAPLKVDVNAYLRSISQVDDVNMEYTLHMTFRQEWIDERLFFNSENLEYIVLADDIQSQIDRPNIFVRVYNATAKILYSSRMTLTLSCLMHLHSYPLDTQTCYLDYASYAYTTEDIEYRWNHLDPIQIKKGMHESLPSFRISSIRTGNCTSVTNTGKYSCLRASVRLKRVFSYYLLQLYVPSFMLVVVSTVSFWLDKDSVPARVTLGVTSVDIWIGVCTGFIFAALLEFSLVNWAARKETIFYMRQLGRLRCSINPPIGSNLSRVSMTDEHFSSSYFFNSGRSRSIYGIPRSIRSQSLFPPSQTPAEQNSHRPSSTCHPPSRTESFRKTPLFGHRFSDWWDDLWSIRYPDLSVRIDLMARIFFPFFFVLFNIIYWTMYLVPYLREPVDDLQRFGFWKHE